MNRQLNHAAANVAPVASGRLSHQCPVTGLSTLNNGWWTR